MKKEIRQVLEMEKSRVERGIDNERERQKEKYRKRDSQRDLNVWQEMIRGCQAMK